jgi:hypothetical protein
MKQEASGYPSWVQTEEDKDLYIEQYYENEGVRLDKDCIEKNPGRRCLAKLMLNSFWGKFGQRDNMPQVCFATNMGEYFNIISDETRNISDVIFMSDGTVRIQFREEDDFVDINPKTNVVIAAFTTALARLKLYSYLEKLQDQVLYFDTDSVIFVTRPGGADLETGEYLGQLTDELEEYGPGSYINEFASAGPKNYAFTVVNDNSGIEGEAIIESCKVKGITQCHRTKDIINFKEMKKLVFDSVLNNKQTEVTISEKRIQRTRTHEVVTKDVSKTWRVVYTKRRLLPDFTTLPWGYDSDLGYCSDSE